MGFLAWYYTPIPSG